MKISCIALDLDRTTLGSNGRLSTENREAIEAAIEQGIHVVIASGRALTSLPSDVLAIPGIQYAITSNGAAVYDLHTGECLKQYKLTAESVAHILKLTEGRGVACEAFIDGQPYAQKEYVEDPVRFGALPKAIPYIQSTRRPVEDMQLFLMEHIKELDCLDLVVKNEKIKGEIRAELEQRVSDIYVTSSVEQLLEISYKDCGKHSGAKVILEHLGLDQEELAAFGDADNDADLLAFAGLGIAMANASPKCREAADWVTLSNDENGVAYGIRQRIIQKNHAFMEMMKVAREWLAGRDPLDIEEKTGILYDEENSCFSLHSLGKNICIHYPDYEISPYVNEWQQLIILHYMKLADGAPLTGTWMAIREIRDGLIRGGDFDLRCENVIRQRLSQFSIEEFSEKCRDIGGKIIDGNADFTVRFDFLPYYPLLLKLWFADDEFPASGKLLVDASADHYLMIEDAVTVGQVVMEKLVGLF